MRIDLFLKHVCLTKSRARAQALCQSQSVTVNARTVRPSATVTEGDRLELALPGRKLIVEVLRVPAKQLSKGDAPNAYRILLDERAAGEEL